MTASSWMEKAKVLRTFHCRGRAGQRAEPQSAQDSALFTPETQQDGQRHGKKLASSLNLFTIAICPLFMKKAVSRNHCLYSSDPGARTPACIKGHLTLPHLTSLGFLSALLGSKVQNLYVQNWQFREKQENLFAEWLLEKNAHAEIH